MDLTEISFSLYLQWNDKNLNFMFFFIHCYLETLQHLGHIASRIFGCIPEGCVFLLLYFEYDLKKIVALSTLSQLGL